MKVALPIWGTRISPVFDSARMLLIAAIEEQAVIDRSYESLHALPPSHRAAKLFDLDIEVLICGAVSDFVVSMVEAYGIRMVPFVKGNVNEVLGAFLQGRLSRADFHMPGFHGRKMKRRHRGRAWEES